MNNHFTPRCDDLAAHQLSGRLWDDDCGILAEHFRGRGGSQPGIAARTGDEMSPSLSLSRSDSVIAGCLTGLRGAPDEIPNAPERLLGVRKSAVCWTGGKGKHGEKLSPRLKRARGLELLEFHEYLAIA